MAYFTKAEARAAAAQAHSVRRRAGKSFDTILREEARLRAVAPAFDVFLSHSINDAELVLGVKALLEIQSLRVYVDWAEDPCLDRGRVTKETAAFLRQRMRQSKSLIFLASENSTASKWMPWEVGYFDGFNPGCVAVMPLLDNANEYFVGQEYLGLYPLVTKSQYPSGTTDVFVEERGVKWSTLRSFGRGMPEGYAYQR
ncbi:toll/interleukin-1 receptor domain-containing protein [Burkholderia ubonensis]|uniref:toll/interleukin-1 receptor domain-containing protein n=1 Tax=Burkholderia ubonensis TaxID=101571 RepID=UPI000BA7D9FC|nr:toll/interleukin-1 receptor domain-containing protein [Burkholderia ubonensis]PAJ85272.1 toll-Interleukin receptor [Burkholderia ubonensis]PAJ92793.1 toll-Interleukin receptor [Burkholderia ubonensis]PAK05497.1 toll-Interleukin receptor [Burkholderia ubonensis]RQP67248.1 TIR domain-containing protein [Burkholderia ubonensis]RQP73320.1 TIR domain-containing protein [Burkholderia ubonensis]